jgi:hypothetical protein
MASSTASFDVVECLNCPERVPTVDDWVEKTRRVLHKDLQTRLKTVSLNSEDAKREFRQLQSLGFKAERCRHF